MNASSGAEEAPDTALGRHMDDSRNDLGLTWDDVARLSKLSRQTLYDIRKGVTDNGRMRSSTRRKIEKTLQWERGSVDAVLSGGTPVAVHTPDKPDDQALVDAPPQIDPRTGTVGDLRRGLAYFHLRFKDSPEDYDRLLALLDLAVHLELGATDTQSSTEFGAHG